MQWYATKMGLHFPTTIRMHELMHSGVQACELAPWELVNLVMMASHAQGSYRLVLAFMIQSAVSCIQFEHMQRSSLIRCGPDHLEFRCAQGKARRQGARPAYNWITPEISRQGWSLISTLRDFYANELLPSCGARFLGYFEEGFWRYNRLRRFLPTLWIHGWRFLPEEPHYSGQKMLQSAHVKNALMKRFFQLFRIKRPELALSVNNLLRTDAWGWEEFAAFPKSPKVLN